MAGGYTGEVAEFTRVHKQVTNANNAVTKELNKLQGNMEATAGVWEGAAAGAFRKLMIEFNRNAKDLNDALQTIGDMLETAGSKYDAQEETESAELSKIMNTLG